MNLKRDLGASLDPSGRIDSGRKVTEGSHELCDGIVTHYRRYEERDAAHGVHNIWLTIESIEIKEDHFYPSELPRVFRELLQADIEEYEGIK